MSFGIDILNIEPTTINSSLKGKYVLLYGAPKIGKTTLAAKFPKALLCALEPGTNALVNAMVAPVTSWAILKDIVNQLDTEEAKEMYDTIIIDTADIAWDYCEKYICLQNKVTDKNGLTRTAKNVGEIPYGQGWGLLRKEFDNLFVQIAMMGYGIVFISHENLVDEQVEIEGELTTIQKATPTLPKQARLIVNRLVDIIGYIRGVQTADGLKRVLFTRSTIYFDAGSRFRYLAPQIELTYENLIKAIDEAVKKELDEHGMKEVSKENVFYKEERPFNEAMEEARVLFQKLFSIEDEEKKAELASIVNRKIFEIVGRNTKISEIEPHEQDLLELLITELKAMVKE